MWRSSTSKPASWARRAPWPQRSTTSGISARVSARGVGSVSGELIALEETRAACRIAAGVHEVPVGREALHRGVLVHGRHDDAVLQCHVTDRNRFEQQWPRHV